MLVERVFFHKHEQNKLLKGFLFQYIRKALKGNAVNLCVQPDIHLLRVLSLGCVLSSISLLIRTKTLSPCFKHLYFDVFEKKRR